MSWMGPVACHLFTLNSCDIVKPRDQRTLLWVIDGTYKMLKTHLNLREFDISNVLV